MLKGEIQEDSTRPALAPEANSSLLFGAESPLKNLRFCPKHAQGA